MKNEEMAIERVIPYARNPRKNETAVAKTAASIKEFGWRQPIVADDRYWQNRYWQNLQRHPL